MLSQAEAERLIAIANTRLGKAGLRLELSGKKLNISLRGMFPPRPGDKRLNWYQTRLSLKLKAIDREAVRLAEVTAREIALELNKGTFSWLKFSDAEDPNASQTVAALLAEYERLWWLGKDRKDPAKQQTWKNYRAALKTFPQSVEVLTLDVLLDWVANDNSKTMRRWYCAIARELAQMSGLPTQELSKFGRVVTTKAVNPRLLPSDAEIVATRDSISDPGWQYIFGLVATYGLRNHEVWWLDYAEFPIVRVREGTKTGARVVEPLYPEWAERWRLDVVVYPENVRLAEGTANGLLGKKVTQWSKRDLGRSIYDYRHCYARRCMEFGLPVDLAARLMGHSQKVHLQTYRAWISDSTYQRLIREAIQKAERSAPF